jgi:succinate dehydrogenase / fumarate reductase cytochrome b subunit
MVAHLSPFVKNGAAVGRHAGSLVALRGKPNLRTILYNIPESLWFPFAMLVFSSKPCYNRLESANPFHDIVCLRSESWALARNKEVNGMAAIANLFRAVTYRGREGHIAWMLHRITGISVFFFLTLHIADIFLMSFGPEVFNSLLFFYHKFLFKLGIVFGLYPAALYHGLNGIRIVTVDLWPDMGKKQATLWRIQIGIFAGVYIPSAIIMLREMFGSH